MGWSFYTNPACNRKFLIEKIKAPGYLSPGYTVLNVSAVGNHVWYLYRNPEGAACIGLTLLKGGGKHSGWGEKGMSEDMGPYELDCPLSILNKADPSTKEWVNAWREKVREYHATKANRPIPAPGQAWQLGDATYRLLEKLAGRRGWRAINPDSGKQYRMPISYLARATFIGDQS